MSVLIDVSNLSSNVPSASHAEAPANRVRVLEQNKSLGNALLELESEIQTECGLVPTTREIVILTAIRRSKCEVTARLPVLRQHGVSDDMIEAILAEDWTDPVFNSAQKAAFQFALQYDAGHSINNAVIEAVRAEFDEPSIISLAIVCGHYGSMARLAIGFQLDRQDNPASR